MKIRNPKDLNINQKLLISYVLVIVVPIMLLCTVTYNYALKFLEGKVTKSILATNTQITENLDTFFRNLAKITEMPYYDKDLNEIMGRDYSQIQEGAEFEKVQDFNGITQDFFGKLILLNQYIDTLYLNHFKSGKIYYKGYHGEYDREDILLNDQQWYKDIIDKNGKEAIVGIHNELPSNKRSPLIITVGRLVVKPFTHERLGVFWINVKPERLQELYKEVTLTPNTKQLIIDENNIVVFSNRNDEIGYTADPDIIGNSGAGYYIGKLNNERVLIVSKTSQYTSWKVVNIIPYREFMEDIIFIRNIFIISGIVLILLAVFISFIIANSISRPLKNLSTMMKLVEKGNFNVEIGIQGNDEIGQLSKTFNKMIVQIKELIENTIVEGEKKRIAELKALQSQINPHFMYNTLNVIKWMAQMQTADNITNTVDSLIYLLNFSARASADFISIRDEVEFLKHYISIMKLRYYNRFDALYDIDEEVYKYKTLKFMLQPFAENSIFHGFDQKRNGYHLILRAGMEDETVVFSIEDDGVGMLEDDVKKVLSEDMELKKSFNSIGISNVVKRIKLHFGNQYGVKISSIPGKGTKVVIDIPKIPFDTKEN